MRPDVNARELAVVSPEQLTVNTRIASRGPTAQEELGAGVQGEPE